MRVNIFNFSIWLCFFYLALLLGIYHEPWADEAQAWLIARDSSVMEILSEYARCEGQPPLWHLLLHFMIKCGLPYSALHLIPLGFSSIGVALFLWKSPFPKWIKALIPFTYFIFFQYAIIARQYCMAFMFLSLLAIIYPNRHKRPFLYALMLCLFGFSSTPALVISGSLYFLFLCENLFLQQSKKENWTASVFVFVFMCFVVWIIFPDPTNPFIANYRDVAWVKRFFRFIPRAVTMPFFFEVYKISGYHFLLFLLPILFIGSFFWKNRQNLLYVCILFCPVIILLALVRFSLWISGFLFLLFIFSLWIFYDSRQFDHLRKNVKLWILTGLLVFHIVLSVKWSLFDILNPYSAGKKVAEFLEPYVQQDTTIVGTSFWAVSVQPYFNKNIYQNFEKGFWVFKKDSKQFSLRPFLDSKSLPDIIISTPSSIGYFGANEEFEFIQKADRTHLYNLYKFDGSIATDKTRLENQDIVVFIKKEIDK